MTWLVFRSRFPPRRGPRRVAASAARQLNLKVSWQGHEGEGIQL